ncbi:hypothetical protein [Streptomyces mangrovisoli]
MRTTRLWWRWRHNPLRRHDDTVEAWLVLAVWLAVVVGGGLAGLAAYRATDVTLAHQRAERHTATAVLVSGTLSSERADGSGLRVSATVRWTAYDGTVRTGSTLVGTGRKAGSAVTVWLDAQGRLTTEPPNSREAALEAGLLGFGAATGAAGAALGAGALARWRLDRRRYAAWDAEWNLVGPLWGHRTS